MIPGGIVVSVDMSTAPVPDRGFSADAGWVVIGVDLVRIVFAQYKAVGPDIEHIVVVRVPFSAAHAFLDSMSGNVASTAANFLESISDRTSPPVNKDSVPTHSVTLDANILVVGVSGREACLDLYHSSPQVRVAIKKGSNEFRAEPVARVTLTTRVLMDIYEGIARERDSIPRDVPEPEIH